MISSILFVVSCLLAHSNAARLLPATLKFMAPSIGWAITSAALKLRSATAFAIVGALNGVFASATCAKLGLRCALASRALYCTLVSYAVGGVLGTVLGRAGCHPSSLATVCIVTAQLWAAAGGMVMLMVFPASIVGVMESQAVRETRYRNAARTLSHEMGKIVERSVTASLNGLQLDTVIVKSARVPSQRWMMYFGGNAEFLENTLEDVAHTAELFGTNLVLFNPRGVGRSNGYVSQVSDLVEDAAAVAQYVVRKEKISPRQLLLFGHSIGGGVAAQIAYRVFPEAALVLDRTFSSLSDAAASFSPLTPSQTQILFPLLVGDLNTIEAWNGIQHDRRLILYAREDEIISYQQASVARLPQFQQRQPDSKFVVELHGPRNNFHNVPINHFDERSTIASYVRRCLGG